MTNWDMATVWDVRRFWVEAKVDLSIPVEHAKPSIAEEFVQQVRVFAVEVDVQDLNFQVDEDAAFCVSRVRCFWSPKTTTLRLVGGQNDGRELQFDRIGDPLRMPETVPLSLSLTDQEFPTATLPVATYEPSGWSETDRVWLYSCLG